MLERLKEGQLKILIVDDDMFVREIISEIMENTGFVTDQAEDGVDALDKYLADRDITLIISDVNMPRMNGLELVEKIREKDMDLPIIMLTVNSEIETAVEAIRLGADDYTLKGNSISETLPISVAKVLETYELKMQNRDLIQDLSRKNEELERLASLDGLTGIPNRRYYDLALDSMWDEAVRSRSRISMIMTDIDKFKEINDSLGHHHGDDCIKAAAKTLNRSLRKKYSFVARYGGDEFIALVPDCPADEVYEIAELMRKRIEKLSVRDLDTDTCSSFTMSFGLCSMVPEYEDEPKDLFDTADKALYAAKEAGRNKVVIK